MHACMHSVTDKRHPYIYVQVNGVDLAGKPHNELVAAIKAAGDRVRLTVRQLGESDADPTPAAKTAAAATAARPAARPSVSGANTILIEILRGPSGFGFNLTTGKSDTGADTHLFRVVDPGGPADRAGAHPGDSIILPFVFFFSAFFFYFFFRWFM
jgi:hypothetical protein